MNNIIYSPFAVKAVAEGRKRHMRFHVRGQGDVPLEPFYKDEWWYEILKSDSIIPAGTKERIEVLKKAGIPITALVIAHEAPRLLVAPKEESMPVRVDDDTSFDLSSVVEAVSELLRVALAVFGFLLVSAISLDPALIAILPDGTWLEVATWYE